MEEDFTKPEKSIEINTVKHERYIEQQDHSIFKQIMRENKMALKYPTTIKISV